MDRNCNAGMTNSTHNPHCRQHSIVEDATLQTESQTESLLKDGRTALLMVRGTAAAADI